MSANAILAALHFPVSAPVRANSLMADNMGKSGPFPEGCLQGLTAVNDATAPDLARCARHSA